MKSNRLKEDMSMMGIQVPRRQEGTSDAMPGYRLSVVKYTSPIDTMYG